MHDLCYLQQFDGMHVWDRNGPSICLVPADLSIGAGAEGRQRVWLDVHVRSSTTLTVEFKDGWKNISGDGWARPAIRSFVDVRNADVFVTQVRWKASVTLLRWSEARPPVPEAAESWATEVVAAVRGRVDEVRAAEIAAEDDELVRAIALVEGCQISVARIAADAARRHMRVRAKSTGSADE